MKRFVKLFTRRFSGNVAHIAVSALFPADSDIHAERR
jgi:hypothetical protein